jgi:hypothetical protein
VTGHPLAGFVSVDASAGRIRRYRWVEERLMRTLAGWIALTPELPVKLLFGRHVWDCAQHADLWGRRLPELRSPAHQGEPPTEGFAGFMNALDGVQGREQSLERVIAVYRVLKPHLITAYDAHLAETNEVYEPPTRRILTRCLEEERRHVAAGLVVLERLAGPARARAAECERALLAELARVGGLVAHDRTGGPLPEPASSAGDVVALDSAFDPAVVDADLAELLEAHRRALAAGDLEAVAAQVAPAARDDVRALYRGLMPSTDATVLACARVGGYRIVKLRLRHPRGASIVQIEWRRGEGRWRIAGGELVRSEPAG